MQENCFHSSYTGKVTLQENADLLGVKEEDLMVTATMHKQLNLHHRSNDFEVEPVKYALMAISSSSSSSSSDNEGQKCSKCIESFKCLQKNYDTEREKHNKAKLEIRGYEIALESLEARILGHEKNEIAWGEKADISFAGLDEYAIRNKIIESKTLETTKTLGMRFHYEDWTSDDEEDMCPVNTVSSVKPNVTQAVRSQADKSGQTSQKQGISFKKVHKIKACFVCKSTDHLIKDCDFYDQKRSETLGLRMWLNMGKEGSQTVWDYRNRPKDLKADVKTFGVKNITTAGSRAVVSKGKVENVMEKANWVWRPKCGSGCSSHMTGNKAYLSDYEDLNGGFVAFGNKHNMVAFLKKPNESVGFTELWIKVKAQHNQLNPNTPVDPSPLQQSPTHPSPLHHSPPHLPHQSPPFSLPHNSPPGSYEAPLPEGNTSGSAEDSMQLKELMVLVPKLVNRIGSLEKELNETKQTLGNVVLKLVKKVKTLETALKRKSKKVLLSKSEGEESEDQGRKFQDIDNDPLVSLVRQSMKEKSTYFITLTKASGEAQKEEIGPTILEAAKTLSMLAFKGVSKEK
ncbi:hypothetical protein Tco_0718624 [Tanacetum coccineum]